MLCEECNQNPAEVSVTTVINGESSTRRLCAQCVKKYQSGDIQSVLAAILSSMAVKQKADIRCEQCGHSFDAFEKTGMLGCAQCYTAFRAQLLPVITRVQGRTQHAGRRPAVSVEEQAAAAHMQELRSQMEAAVQAEDFETAARCRDELRAMTAAREASV